MKYYLVISIGLLMVSGQAANAQQIASDEQLESIKGPAPDDALRKATDFFNGVDLTGWSGSQKYWKVEDGAIVGVYPTAMKKCEYLWSTMPVKDFYLALDAKIEPHGANAGIQFRSKKINEHGVHGYQADMGNIFWGKLYHEHSGRGKIDWNDIGWKAVKKGQWNRYEILAVGDCIWTAINGTLSVSIKDPKGERSGYIALQIHGGPPQTVRYRIDKLIHNPKVELVGKTEEQLRAALREPEN